MAEDFGRCQIAVFIRARISITVDASKIWNTATYFGVYNHVPLPRPPSVVGNRHNLGQSLGASEKQHYEYAVGVERGMCFKVTYSASAV